MQVIENKKIDEKVYVEKLDNGLTIMIFPKNTRKKWRMGKAISKYGLVSGVVIYTT